MRRGIAVELEDHADFFEWRHQQWTTKRYSSSSTRQPAVIGITVRSGRQFARHGLENVIQEAAIERLSHLELPMSCP